LLTDRTFNRCIDTTSYRITAVGCTQITVVTDQRGARLAVVNRITGLCTVTDICIITGTVVRGVHTGILGLVTAVSGTANSVIAVRRGSRHTGPGVTDLCSIAEQPVVTVSINHTLGRHFTYSVRRITLLTGRAFHRCIDTTVDRITAVGCTQITIIANQRITRLAVVNRIAELCTVADIPVVTGQVIRCVLTGIANLVAGVHGTANPVIAVRRGSWQTVTYRITGLNPVAI